MRKLLVISALCGFVIFSLAFTQQQEPHYKNLKVLPKNITHDQLDSVMKHFARSLGVKCNFCHAPTADGKHLNFASDSLQHKLTARYMMKMTNKINKKFFKEMNKEHPGELQAVTCFTCHHGNEEPGNRPPAREEKRD